MMQSSAVTGVPIKTPWESTSNPQNERLREAPTRCSPTTHFFAKFGCGTGLLVDCGWAPGG